MSRAVSVYLHCIVSGIERWIYSTTRHHHTVLQHLDLSGLHRCSVCEGDERSRYDGRQERAHGVAMAFVTSLHPVLRRVGDVSIIDCSLNNNNNERRGREELDSPANDSSV
jgi:hypothetical protein